MPDREPQDRDASAFQTPVTLETDTVAGTSDGTVRFLRDVADRLEREPEAVLIGLWSTGFGRPEEAVYQVVIDRQEGSGNDPV